MSGAASDASGGAAGAGGVSTCVCTCSEPSAADGAVSGVCVIPLETNGTPMRSESALSTPSSLEFPRVWNQPRTDVCSLSSRKLVPSLRTSMEVSCRVVRGPRVVRSVEVNSR